MGNSTIDFRGLALSSGDYTLECWLYFLACEVDEQAHKPDWLLEAQDRWNFSARIGLIGTIDAGLDDYLVDDERIQIVLQLAHDTMNRLQTFGDSIDPEQIKNLGDLTFIPDERGGLGDPADYFADANLSKLGQYGTLFCELLQGTLHPAKERIMRGYGLYRVVSIIDYLATLIPDGDIGAAGIRVKLDQQGEKQIWIGPDVYWVSEKSPTAKFTRYKKQLGICEGMPDLAIDVYPLHWLKEKITFELHELYNLQEHWYIDDESHIVTIRRLIDDKVVVVEVLHAGEQFTSTILGGKVVNVDTLLRTE